MNVGDLVRHQMYNESKAPALVLEIDASHRIFMIKILDPDEGVATWDSGRDYEVINASR